MPGSEGSAGDTYSCCGSQCVKVFGRCQELNGSSACWGNLIEPNCVRFRLVSRRWFLFEAKSKQILVLCISIVCYGRILIDLVCHLLQYFGLMNCDNPNNVHIYFCNTSL